MMEQFKVYTPRTRKARREKRIEQARLLIEAREHKARITERYLRMFRHCMTEARHRIVANHLRRTIQSIHEMRSELDAMVSGDVSEQLIFNN